MAMSVVYTTINGMIVHENRGGVESFYAPDTMGSTVALLNSSGLVTDTYTYWPYGEIRSHVGSSQTPFTFLGMIGYYTDVVGNFIYVRARYLRQALTRWQTVDLLWPMEPAFSYVGESPQTFMDPSGLTSLGCEACAASIYVSWDNSPQHSCRSWYAHCMACCVLANSFGKACAVRMQRIQQTGRGGDYRMPTCLYGASVGVGLSIYGDVLGGCDKACSAAYSPTKIPSTGGPCSNGGMNPFPSIPFGCGPAVIPPSNPGRPFSGSPSYDGGLVRHTGGCSGVVID